jgi:hypothetical protein
MKQKSKPINHITRLGKAFVITLVLASLVGGLIATVIAINHFKNYNSPYLFGFLFATIGVVAGIWITNKFRPIIIINQKIQQNYSLVKIYVSIGLIGISLLLGHVANSFLAKRECGNFKITEKIFKQGGFKQIGLNILIIDIDGVSHRYLANSKSWQQASVGQQAEFCNCKGNIGFDFIKMSNQ